MQKRRSLNFGIVFLFCFPFAVPAIGMVTSVCDQAAQYAAEKTGVPVPILRSISLAETGHTDGQSQRFGSWPWAVQSKGQGTWLNSKEAAVSFINGLIAQDIRNIDIGCFQLNLHWHSTAFESLEEMITPDANALYAAQFLKDLYQESGDWRIAVGRYHSQNPARAKNYVERVTSMYDRHISADQENPIQPEAAAPDRSEKPYKSFALVKARGPLIQAREHAPVLIGVEK